MPQTLEERIAYIKAENEWLRETLRMARDVITNRSERLSRHEDFETEGHIAAIDCALEEKL